MITKGPDPILPARMYWMKIVPPVAASKPDFTQAPIGDRSLQVREMDARLIDPIGEERRLLGRRSGIDGVNYRFVGESGTRLAGLMAGEFDIITEPVAGVHQRAPKANVVLGLEQPIMILSAISGVTQDERVRQALNLAIDKDGIATGLFDANTPPSVRASCWRRRISASIRRPKPMPTISQRRKR